MDKIFDQILAKANKVLIISGIPVDFDSIGSGLIIKKYCESLGKEVTHIISAVKTPYFAEKFAFLPYFDELQFLDSREVIGKQAFDTLIMLDGGNTVQFYNSYIGKQDAPDFSLIPNRVLIDHHLGNPDFPDTHIIHTLDCSSTCELILTRLIPESFLTSELATLAYAGIVDDTGNFKWNLHPHTFPLAGALLQKGARVMEVIDALYFSNEKSSLQNLVWVINHLTFDDDLQTVFLLLPLSLQQQERLSSSQLSEYKDTFYSYIAKYIKGYVRGFIVREMTPENIYISARANEFRNKVNFPELFKKFGGNGGGHFMAASITAQGSFDEVYTKLKDEIHKAMK